MIAIHTIQNAIRVNVILRPREFDNYRADPYEGYSTGYLLLIFFATKNGYSREEIVRELNIEENKVEALEKRLNKLLIDEDEKITTKIRLIENYFIHYNHK